MRKVLDERVRLPKFVRHILFMIFGISGIVLMTRGNYEASYLDSLLLLVSSIYAGLASYGAFCLLHDIKKSTSIGGFFRNIIDKFEITFYDSDTN
tara:strand:+ start:8864 stop:9148 length:285 start_codon:yes stop_codon:yes gene_type:complete